MGVSSSEEAEELLTLLLMRHAKSSWSEPTLSDHDRPLNARGRHAAPRMGELIEDEDLLPDIIVTSSARRAVETAQAVVMATGYEGPTEVTKRLYLAEPGAYLDVLSEVDPGCRRVLMIGHNPGISELASMLAGRPIDLPTAALVEVEFDAETFADITFSTRAKVRNVWRPKEL